MFSKLFSNLDVELAASMWALGGKHQVLGVEAAITEPNLGTQGCHLFTLLDFRLRLRLS